MATAVLKSIVGAVSIRTHDPDGKEYIFSWNEKNNFSLEVPTVFTYHDKWENKEKVFFENFAQNLLDNNKDMNRKSETYGQPIFELVEVVEKPKVEAPAVVDRKKIKKEKVQ